MSRDALQALDQGGEAPEGAEEDFEEDPGYDQEQQEGERLHTRPPCGERFICRENDLRITIFGRKSKAYM
jgi:hypothetical protein